MELSTIVILTGASGFIGQHVMRRLKKQRIRFVTMDIRAIEDHDAASVCVRTVDGTLLDFSDLQNCTLIHLAWCPPLRDSMRPHAQQLKLLAKLMDAHGDSIDRIIGLGSAEEYGSRSGRLEEPETINNALSPYGWGKRAAQMLVETWCEVNSKSALWFRPFTVYGEGQHGNMAIPYAVSQALRREAADFSTGTQQRDFIHVDDVARAIELAVTGTWKGFNIANLGTGVGTRLRDVLEQIAVLFDVAGSFRFGVRSMRPGEPEVQIAAINRAESLIGFTARITLDQGLYRMYEAIQHQHGVS
jgi:nucleoside-diphosphate-sugar epimerase